MTDTETRLENIERILINQGTHLTSQARELANLRQDVESVRQDVLAIRQDLAAHRREEQSNGKRIDELTRVVEGLVEEIRKGRKA